MIFVCFSYACNALLKSSWRLEDEEDVKPARDIMVEAYREMVKGPRSAGETCEGKCEGVSSALARN